MLKCFAYLLCLMTVVEYQAEAFKTYTCVFGEKYGKEKPEPHPNDKPDEVFTHEHGRNLQTITRNTIRITLDTTDFNTIKTPPNS